MVLNPNLCNYCTTTLAAVQYAAKSSFGLPLTAPYLACKRFFISLATNYACYVLLMLQRAAVSSEAMSVDLFFPDAPQISLYVLLLVF
jgi:hypothetical protein